MNEIAPCFAALEPYLKEFRDNEERIFFLKEALAPIEVEFLKMIQSFRKSQDPLNLESAIRLLGAHQAHDLLIAFTLWNFVDEKPFAWDKNTGRPVKTPQEILPYCTKIKDAFGEDMRSYHQVFLSALAFDVLYHLNLRKGTQVKKTQDLMESQFDGALKVARIGIQEGKKAEGLTLEKYLISTILLKRTGRIIFSMLHPEYAELAQSIRQNGLRSRLAHLAERAQYGVSNNMLSCLLCKFIPGLEVVNAALLYYDYPFMLKDHLTPSNVSDLVDLCADLQAKES